MTEMSDLPAPLTPAECDLRGLEWMPLYGDRLFASDTWLMAGPEGRCAALSLWWAAWKQRPAGSVPGQDRALAQIAGYGMAVDAWLAVRDEALHGWVRCSDGRLYHPTVCSLAAEAWDRRKKERARKAGQRARKSGTSCGQDADVLGLSRGTGAGQDADAPRDSDGTGRGQDADVRVDRTGQDKTGKEEPKATPSDAPAVAVSSSLVETDIRSALWRDGLPILRRLLGKSDAQCRSLLGRLLRDTHDDCARLYGLLREAESLRPFDTSAWLTKAVAVRYGAAPGRKSKIGRLVEYFGDDAGASSSDPPTIDACDPALWDNDT